MQTDEDARARLTVEMPRNTADLFIARSRHHHRTPRAQMRVLIERFLNEPPDDEPERGVYAGVAA